MRKFDLKSCPFCGDPNPQVVWDSGDEELLGVKCFNCGGCIDTEKDTVYEAVEAWNNRVIDLVDLEGYSDKLWRAAYERGKADAWATFQTVYKSTLTLCEAEDIARGRRSDESD